MRKLAILMIFLAAAGAEVQAKDLPISAFYGHFVGEGQASTLQGGFFDVSARDLDVIIKPVEGGVEISWTTFLRKGTDPNNQEVVKRSTTITFLESAQPNLFIERRGADPFDNTPLSWTRIEGRTLTTYTFLVDKDGIYTVSSYARKLGSGGKTMELRFKSFRDGEWVRSARADLRRK